MRLGDTIVAIATPLARAGLGVVRLSGPASRHIAQQLLHLDADGEWPSWTSRYARLFDEAGSVLDQVVATFFARPRSYTAEDVIEISCHGAPVVLEAALSRALACGARLAEPGEFTLRAFLNGRVSLPQAEAVRDLIDATTLYQARVAAQQVEGSLARRLRPVKEQMLELIALLEAGIDFAEDDIDVASAEELMRRLTAIQTEVRRMVDSFRAGRLVFQGFTLAIVGRPNVGKSSLFNRLLDQDRAIVTDLPGTTRDLVSETTTLAGLPVKLVDTAGIRAGQDPVERLGVERSYAAMADADLTLLVVDLSAEESDEDRSLRERLQERRPLVAGNKGDLQRRFDGSVEVAVSALTGEGVDDLRQRVLDRVAPGGLAQPASGSITAVRHHSLLTESAAALDNASRAIEYGLPHEMLLVDLYAALAPIDAITGATTADDILHRIFSTFCIGK